MRVSTATDDGYPARCSVCGQDSFVDISWPAGDSVCPYCGALIWVSRCKSFYDGNHFAPDLFIPILDTPTADSVIYKMLVAFAEHLDFTEEHVSEDFAQIIERERLGSTGIGNGYAIPHFKTGRVDRCYTICAKTSTEVDFKAPDGIPIHTFVVLASPVNKPGDHLRNLEKLSRILPQLGKSNTDGWQ